MRGCGEASPHETIRRRQPFCGAHAPSCPRERARPAVIDSLKRVAARMRRGAIGAWRQFYIDADPDHRKTTFLAGSGRGGTTWIAELVNHDNEYRFMFEPFFARHVPEVRSFRNRQYLRPDDDDPAFVEPARLVVTGKLRNRWTDYFNRRIVAHKRLVKDIRANLFLKWLDRHFPGMPIVLLFRHPFAVAASRLHHEWNNDLADFLKQDRLMADHLEPFRTLIENVTDPFERHVVQWCIENYVPLRQFRRGEIHLAFYESFSAQPRDEIGRLFDFLGKPVTAEAFGRAERPSTMTWARPGTERAQTSTPEGWQRYVSKERAARSLEIVKRFGLDAIYTESPLPNREAAVSLLAPGGT
jgi:hypothetical protein